MKTLTERRLEVFEDMISYYHLGNRGTVRGGSACRYHTPDGKMCQIGRMIGPEKAKELEDIRAIVYDEIVKEHLPAEILELGLIFLRDLQRFHDDRSNWSKKGLSRIGKAMAERLRRRITEDSYSAGVFDSRGG